jgi:hypothetical protein
VAKIDDPRVSHLQLPVRQAPFTRGGAKTRTLRAPLGFVSHKGKELTADFGGYKWSVAQSYAQRKHCWVRPGREHEHGLQQNAAAR